MADPAPTPLPGPRPDITRTQVSPPDGEPSRPPDKDATAPPPPVEGTGAALTFTPKRTNRKATTEDIVTAYRETGSIWKAGKRLGLAGQSVHERLRAIDYPMLNRHWTSDERTELRKLVEAGLPLGEVARRLGRTFGATATVASQLGIRVKRNHEVRLPRGAGFDKRSTHQHLRALSSYDGSVTQYARNQGLRVEFLVQALERHVPEAWAEYVAQHSDLPERECGYCERVFIPNSGKQRYCSRKCAADARADRAYFNGNRRHAIGMDVGVCQLCGHQGHKGLSAHHMLGKDNDPGGHALVALCRGCHKILSLLASRTMADDPAAWEALISLTWIRRHGADAQLGDAIYAYVEIESGPEDRVG